MENGAGNISKEHQAEEVELGSIKLETANEDAGDSNESEGNEDNDVFEEAVDSENLLTLHQQGQTDGQIITEFNGDGNEVVENDNGMVEGDKSNDEVVESQSSDSANSEVVSPYLNEQEHVHVPKSDGMIEDDTSIYKVAEAQSEDPDNGVVIPSRNGKEHVDVPEGDIGLLEVDKAEQLVEDQSSDRAKVVTPLNRQEQMDVPGSYKELLKADKAKELDDAETSSQSAMEVDAVGSDKSHESTEAVLNGNRPEEPAGAPSDEASHSIYAQSSHETPEEEEHGTELFNESSDVQIANGSAEESEAVDSEKFDGSTNEEVMGHSSKEVEPVAFKEKAEDLDGSVCGSKDTKDAVQINLNHIVSDGAINGGVEDVKEALDSERMEDYENEEAAGSPDFQKFGNLNHDDSNAASHLKSVSPESAELNTDEKNAGRAIESHSEGPPEEDSSSQGRKDIDSGKRTFTAVEVRPTYQHLTNGVEKILKVDDKDVDDKDVVLVEDEVDLSSSDKEEVPVCQPQQQPATSHPENSGGPSLLSRPAGLGSSAPLLEPSSRSLQHTRTNGTVSQKQPQPVEELVSDEQEENKETREKLQMIRVKFLRLANRLGQTPHNVVVAQVLYRLGLAEQLWGNASRAGAFGYDRASVMAEQLEAVGQDPLDFTCTIMVIGKSGVGKSATINSIFDERKLRTDAFQLSTKKVQDIEGTVQGIKVRVIDTPGLSSSSSDQRHNEKILLSVKRFISKTPPDIVLYFDRLDMQSRDFGDVPLLRSITDTFGASIWFNAIVVLTHAASAPPDGPNGPLSYEMFVTQRTHVVQQAIRQAAGDLRLMNPVSLVENHAACRVTRTGQRVLPNGQIWKPQLLLLSFASKILAEANMLLKLQDSPPGRSFGSRPRVPPLPFLLSSLLQSRPQLRLPEDHIGDEDAVDEDLVETFDSGDETEDYDELPPFKRLTKSQLAKLNKLQRKAFFEELEYREKLFYKKQLKEEKKRCEMLKKMEEARKDLPNGYSDENIEDENSGPASVPVPMPDLVLPASFDSDYPSHRYRFLDSSSQWLVRPVLETQGWDHDVGYEGLNVERLFVVKDKVPVSVSGQLAKDKKDCNLQMELGTSLKHSEATATSLGLDVQTIGKDMAYTIRGETRFKNFRRNNTAAGVSVNILGDAMSAGVKIEDKLIVNKRLRVLMSGGAMTGRGEVAYGGRLEATLKDKDFPIGRALSTLALSIVDWHGDLAIGCNVQSQLPLGRVTNLVGHANFSNRGSGQVGVRLNSSEHVQIALLALVPVLRNIKRILSGSSQ